MDNIDFSFALESDYSDICSLLSECELPFEDITASDLVNFIIAKKHGDLVGLVGIQILGRNGLLRSLCVKPEYQRNGIGNILFKKILSHAHLKKINNVYILTTTAESYFKNKSFTKVERENVPADIKKTSEFTSLCPASAICMVRNLCQEL